MKEKDGTFEPVVSLYQFKTFIRLRLNSLKLKIKTPEIDSEAFYDCAYVSDG